MNLGEEGKGIVQPALPGSRPAMAARRSGATDQGPRLRGADYEIVKVAAHLEPTGLSDAADLHGLEAGRSDQLFDLPAGTLVVRGIEEDGRLR